MNKLIENIQYLYDESNESLSQKDFYIGVYKYIKFIQPYRIIAEYLDNDTKKHFETDKELAKNMPLEYQDDLIESMRYLEGINIAYPSSDFRKLRYKIYEPIKLYVEEGIQILPCKTMLEGRQFPKNKLLRLIKLRSFTLDNFDYLYIDNFENWKKLLQRFNESLIFYLQSYSGKYDANEKVAIADYSVGTIIKEFPKIILNPDGSYNYRDISGHYKPSTQKFKFLNILYKNKNTVVPYSAMIKEIFNTDTVKKSHQMSLNRILRDIKSDLKVDEDIFISHRNIGYEMKD